MNSLPRDMRWWRPEQCRFHTGQRLLIHVLWILAEVLSLLLIATRWRVTWGRDYEATCMPYPTMRKHRRRRQF